MFETSGIQRVSIVYRPDNLLPAMRDFSSVLGVAFEGPYTHAEAGIRIAISWQHGIELLSPLDGGAHSANLWQMLHERGEGVCSIGYRVHDLDSAELRARLYGSPRLVDRIGLRRAHCAWWDRYDANFALPIAPVAGVPITLVDLQERSASDGGPQQHGQERQLDVRSASSNIRSYFL